jgi:hypothetical protein
MEQRGLRSHGGPGVEDRRQHFVVDIDTPGRGGIHATAKRVRPATLSSPCIWATGAPIIVACMSI